MTNTLRVLEGFGNRYIKEDRYLGNWMRKRDVLKNDWFQALDFSLSRAYFQGRNDKLSERYYEAARKVLLTYFGKELSTQTRRYNNAWDEGIIPKETGWWKDKDKNSNYLRTGLGNELKNADAGKTRDIEMVLDILRFIHHCPSNNIVLYSIEEIKKGRTKELSLEIKSIRQIGPKITSLYLRDLPFLYDLNLPSKDTQPIDTWVSQVLTKLKICSKENKNEKKIDKLLDACEKANVDPNKVNAGAWYLGANAFDILLDCILNDGGKSNEELAFDMRH